MTDREVLIDEVRQYAPEVPPGFARAVIGALINRGYRILPPLPPPPERSDHPQPRTYE